MVKKFCKLLDDMIADEDRASVDYNELKGAGHPILNLLIECIRRDEVKHAHLLKALKSEVCR